MSKGRDKQTIPNTLAIVGIWISIILYLAATIPISLHSSLSHRCLLSLYYKGCQRFCIFCTHTSERGDKRTFPNTLTIIVEWNSKTAIFAATIPISLHSSLFYYYKGCQRCCIFFRHMSRRKVKQTICHTLAIV